MVDVVSSAVGRRLLFLIIAGLLTWSGFAEKQFVYPRSSRLMPTWLGPTCQFHIARFSRVSGVDPVIQPSSGCAAAQQNAIAVWAIPSRTSIGPLLQR